MLNNTFSIIFENTTDSFLHCSRLNLEIQNVNRNNDDERKIKSDRVMLKNDRKTECINPPCQPHTTKKPYVNKNGTFCLYLIECSE